MHLKYSGSEKNGKEIPLGMIAQGMDWVQWKKLL